MSSTGTYDIFPINDLSGGLNLSASPLSIHDNQMQELKNGVVTLEGAIVKREGYTLASAHEIPGQGIATIFRYYLTNGNAETIVTSYDSTGNKVYRYTTSSGFTEITGGTAFSTNKINMFMYRDYLFLWDGVNTFKCYYLGGSLQDVIFKGGSDHLETKRNITAVEICDDRMFFVFSDTPNSVFFSDYAGWTGTESPASGDGIQIPITNYFTIKEQRADQRGVVALKAYATTDELIIFRENDTWILLGVGATDYVLRKLRGEAGLLSLAGQAETDDGDLFVGGNGKMFAIQGGQMFDVGEDISPLLTTHDLRECTATYDSSRNLVYFTFQSFTLVCNIIKKLGTQSKLAWTVFDYGDKVANNFTRFDSSNDSNAVWMSFSGDRKLYYIGGNSDNGANIHFTFTTKVFDFGVFSEDKFFRHFHALQDTVTTEPYTVSLILDAGFASRGPFQMVVPSVGAIWGAVTWGSFVWVGANYVNGKLDMGHDLRFQEIAVKIESNDALPLAVHRIGLEVKSKNRVRDYTFGRTQ